MTVGKVESATLRTTPIVTKTGQCAPTCNNRTEKLVHAGAFSDLWIWLLRVKNLTKNEQWQHLENFTKPVQGA